MSETFVWTPDYTKRFFELKFENEELFQLRKQPWAQFHAILIKEGFPEEMTVDHVRKKWGYTYESYQLAKKAKNKKWKYYKLFESHYGNRNVFDKFSFWNDEWRIKLIDAVMEAKMQRLENDTMWRSVENKLRSQDLPIDCSVQDIKPLFNMLTVVYHRKHKQAMSIRSQSSDWPQYNAMKEYYKIEEEYGSNRKKKSIKMWQAQNVADFDNCEFQWTKDITETFINIRLQHDWLFASKAGRWKELCAIMIQEYGFPTNLTSREISRKWCSTYAEYLKAKATNNTSFCYYNVFETHFNVQRYSLNPLKDWKEEWVKCLIEAKIKAEQELSSNNFVKHYNFHVWREVEKHLRLNGLPIENSLFDLEDIWGHLIKTFKLKRKLEQEGKLTEEWPYYKLMADYKSPQYPKLKIPILPKDIKKTKVKAEKKTIDKVPDNDISNTNIDVSNTDIDFHDYDFDSDDDVKLLDLKQAKLENKISCRSCLHGDGSIDIFSNKESVDIAYKLMKVCGVEVEQTDNLPMQICMNCARALELAYNFIESCKMADSHHRKYIKENMTKETIKTEIVLDQDYLDLETDLNDVESYEQLEVPKDVAVEKPKTNHRVEIIRKRPRRMEIAFTRTGRKKYLSKIQMCDICGKDTRDIKKHLLIHTSERNHSCEYCGKKFKFKSGLYSHTLIHKQLKFKTCEVCGKTLSTLGRYKRHLAIHTNERKFACETCGKGFNSMDVLKVHVLIHTGERRFTCADCGKSFRTSGCVTRHRRIVHKKVKEKNID